MLPNTHKEKYSKINTLIQYIESDIDEMLLKAENLKKGVSLKVVSENDADTQISIFKDKISTVTPQIKQIEAVNTPTFNSDENDDNDFIKEDFSIIQTFKEDDNNENVLLGSFENETETEIFENDESIDYHEQELSVKPMIKTKDVQFQEEDVVVPVFKEDDLNIENVADFNSNKGEEDRDPAQITATVFFKNGDKKQYSLRTEKEIGDMFIKRMNKHAKLKTEKKDKVEKRKPVKKNGASSIFRKIADFFANIIKRK